MQHCLGNSAFTLPIEGRECTKNMRDSTLTSVGFFLCSSPSIEANHCPALPLDDRHLRYRPNRPDGFRRVPRGQRDERARYGTTCPLTNWD